MDDMMTAHKPAMSPNAPRPAQILTLVLFLGNARAYQDVCMADTFKPQCDPGDVVVMETALYGRMEPGVCLKPGISNIGCSNDILYVLDQWCSGLNQCQFTPLLELAKIKDDWCGDAINGYLRADYTCLSVIEKDASDCSANTAIKLTQHEGFLASHVTDETGCGSQSSPWVIEAKPGQTINIHLLDFSSTNENSQTGECSSTLATIFERSAGRNQSICGGLQRKRDIYRSKSNVVEIQMNTNRGSDGRFILHYQTIGCPDLSPPAHAWYSREGNQATIGCDVTERVWHLQCEENRWKGVVGNCSMAEKETHTTDGGTFQLPNFTILILGAIIVSTVVLSLVILSIGCYHNRRYRRSHRTNKEQMTALTIYRKSTEVANSHYRPVSTCSSCHGTLPTRGQTQEHASPKKSPDTAPGYAHIWERPLPDPHHKRAPSAGSEYLSPKNTDSARSNPPGGASDTQKTSLFDEDNPSSFYSPETGHKYYVLDQAQC